ncbi:biotin/lipoyl-containing protein [Micromonospora sp. NPDC000442]|uniref:biotin/lipoyl-containing protein n=1 Tax=Micromonospora sp. NPDC000442 TaxID=3364217 RepID=UPI00368AEBF6
MVDIRIPRLNTNDASYVLVEWLVDDGATVQSGATVATVETSKALEDLVSEHTGVLNRRLPAGADCRPGQVVAVLTPSSQPSPVTDPGREEADVTPQAPRATPAALVITEPARTLMREHGLDEQDLATLGRALIRRSDVEALLAGGPVGPPLDAPETTAASREDGHARPAR